MKVYPEGESSLRRRRGKRRAAAGIMTAVCILLMLLPAAGRASGDGGDLPVPGKNTACYQIVCRDDRLEQMMLKYVPDYKEGERLGTDLGSRVTVKTGMLGEMPVRWTIIDASETAYMNYLDTLLLEQEERSDNDRIDLFAVSSEYLSKYCDETAEVTVPLAETGLREEDLAGQYEIMKVPGCDISGRQRAVTPFLPAGVWAYRRSIAEEVFGSDDPGLISGKLGTWQDFTDTAAAMKEKGFRMYSGYTDTWKACDAGRETAWISEDGTISFDRLTVGWVRRTSADAAEGRTGGTERWSDAWVSDYGSGGRTFGTYLTVSELKALIRETDASQKNDWACVCGPGSYADSCTWYCAAAGSSHLKETGDIFRKLFCTEETLQALLADTGEGVNHRDVMERAAADDAFKSTICSGQNLMEVLDRAASACSTENRTVYDDGLAEIFISSYLPFFRGETDEASAMHDFYELARKRYPDLLI